MGAKVDQLMFMHRKTRKELGEVLGVTGASVSNKVYGNSKWSVEELFATADFFGLEVADLLPRRVDTPVENEESPSEEGDSKKMVAGAGFEPTTSGL
ncbi:XRE family transcriptional regulator [Corynebacterium yudongzhengii]|uniref:XRE family transcriptional regulator n=1 Tax=Corynebacterium yudongzhengii TaxID=2080740 RepID=A0A2U1T529_9CORY|nr:XRE family transcriptional regulator [Corynebacterium yudongzhengii]PWC01101.1 XRE family transcriptional regulator [Corynebacterium yudongzhengii]